MATEFGGANNGQNTFQVDMVVVERRAASKRNMARQAGATLTILVVFLLLLLADSLTRTSMAAPVAGAIPSPTGTSTKTSKSQAAPEACAYSGHIQSSPNSGSSDNSLYATVAIADRDIWAVGYAGNQTLTEHWDGNNWSIIPSPNVGTQDTLVSVAAVASNDVWAIGSYYNSNDDSYRMLTEHWDGSAWTIKTSPTNGAHVSQLLSVSAAASDDVWAVGYYYSSGTTEHTLAIHWNGTYWSIVSSLNVGSDVNELHGVSATSSTNAWAVGYFYNTYVSAYRVLVEHWNGTQWSIVSCPDVGSTDENDLESVVALAGNDVWAVGHYTDQNDIKWTLTEHWDGANWHVTSAPGNGPYGNELYSVSAASSNDVWAAGDYQDSNSHYHTLMLHWNGSSWATVSSPNHAQENNFLLSTTAVANDDIWGVGFYEDANLTERTLIVHITATCPTATATITPTLPPPTFTPIVCSVQFTDVDMGNTFYGYIRCLACEGIVSGYSDGTFRPGNDVTRGQIAKIVSNAAGFSEPHSEQTFEDIPTTQTFYIYIERLASRNFISGYPCGGAGEPCGQGNLPYFRSNSSTSRGQLAKITCRAFYCQGTPTGQTFADVPPSYTFYTDIEQLYARSAISGYPCGGAGEPCDQSSRPYFRPAGNVSRGQTTKIVASLFFPDCQTP